MNESKVPTISEREGEAKEISVSDSLCKKEGSAWLYVSRTTLWRRKVTCWRQCSEKKKKNYTAIIDVQDFKKLSSWFTKAVLMDKRAHGWITRGWSLNGHTKPIKQGQQTSKITLPFATAVLEWELCRCDPNSGVLWHWRTKTQRTKADWQN